MLSEAFIYIYLGISVWKYKGYGDDWAWSWTFVLLELFITFFCRIVSVILSSFLFRLYLFNNNLFKELEEKKDGFLTDMKS